MGNDILISIVIPVYNVLPYINECMDSILSQAREGMEIILVDDGSTDGSGKVCDFFSSNIAEINVIHKPNGGLASARNAGIAAARGLYISFIDSDDRLASGAMDRVFDWAMNMEADICFLNCVKFFPDGSKKPFGCEIHPEELRGISADEALNVLSRLSKFPDAACIKLYRRSFIESKSILFPDDRRFSEDLGFAIDCFLNAHSFDAIDGPYYEYRQNREGSITSKLTPKHFYDLVTFVKESVSKLTDQGGVPKNEKCESCLSFVSYELAIMIWMLDLFDGEDRKRAIQELEKYRWIMTYGRGRKAILVSGAVKLLGFNWTAKLLSFYMRLR